MHVKSAKQIRVAKQNRPVFTDVHIGLMDQSVRTAPRPYQLLPSAIDAKPFSFFLGSDRGPEKPIKIWRGPAPRRLSKFNNPQALRRSRRR